MWAFKRGNGAVGRVGWYVEDECSGTDPYLYTTELADAKLFKRVEDALAWLQRAAMRSGQCTQYAPNNAPPHVCIDSFLVLVDVEEVPPVPQPVTYRERCVIR